VDPTWDGNENGRPGYQTIRTCQAGAMLPAGCTELVVDLYRLLDDEVQDYVSQKDATSKSRSSGPLDMSRFEDGWEVRVHKISITTFAIFFSQWRLMFQYSLNLYQTIQRRAMLQRKPNPSILIMRKRRIIISYCEWPGWIIQA